MENEVTVTAGNSPQTFTVKGKGYSEQFTDKTAAQAQYELLQKRQIQQKKSGKVSLSINTPEGSFVEREVNIGESFFNKD